MQQTAMIETRRVDDDATSLACRVASGELDETDVRTFLAVTLFESDIASRAVRSALRSRFTTETLINDMVCEARALLFDLCIDTSRTSALDLSRLVSGETSICGWAYKVVHGGTRFVYDRMTVERRAVPECELSDTYHGVSGNRDAVRFEEGFMERAVAAGIARPTHPTRTRTPVDTVAGGERLLDAAEVQATLMGYAVHGGPGWIETSTRSIITGFGVRDMPKRLASRTCRIQLLSMLDTDPRWAQNQLTALACEREGERVMRPIDPMVRNIVGHLETESLRDLSEHTQAADMVLRYAATPRPVVTMKAAGEFRRLVSMAAAGAVSALMVTRLCNAYVSMASELTAPERSVNGAKVKTAEQVGHDRDYYIRTCLLVLKKSDALGATVEDVTSVLEDLLEHLLSDRTPVDAVAA